MLISYHIGQFTSQNAYSCVNYTDDYGFFSQGQGAGPTPPPASTRIILGLSMIALGLTVDYNLTPNIAKGLVEDDLNLITR